MDQNEEWEILIEWPEQYGIVKASLSDNIESLKNESQKAMNLAMGTIRSMAYKVSRSIKEIDNEARPNEVEVEFSIKLECEGGAVIPLIAKTTTGGQFTVKFKWNIEKPKTANLLIETPK